MSTVQTQNLEPVPSQTPMLESDPKLITPTWMRWFTNMRAKINVINASIVSLAGGATAGILASNGSGSIIPRTLTAGTGISITDGTGALGNPVISASGGAGGSPMHVTTNTATSYTAQLTDAPASTANVGWIDSQNSSANVINIDKNANVAFPIGTDIYVCQGGSGQTTINALDGVTFNGPSITPSGPYGVGRAVQISTDSWRIFGNLAFSVYATYTTTVLADNPVLFHLMNDTSGTTSTNLGSLIGANATYTGGYTLGVNSGNTGIPTCVGLNGSTGYLVTPSIGPFASSASISVEIWVKATGSNPFPRIIDIANTVSIAGNSNIPELVLSGAVALNSGYSISTSATTLTHIVFTCGPSGHICYINGSVVASDSTAYSALNPSAIYYIGRYSGGGYYWLGDLAAHAVYLSVLSPARVLAHYNAGI